MDEPRALTDRDLAAPPAGRLGAATLLHLLLALRPKQWTKNGLVYVAFLFSLGQSWRVRDPDIWLPLLGAATSAFVAFTMASGAQYLINDLRDREQDRVHPRKRRRPIAAGLVPAPLAAGTAAVLLPASLLIAAAVNWQLAGILLAYLAMMLAYSYGLKHLVIMDLMIIAVGFVLRAVAGGIATDIPLSPWLYLCTFLGALFLALGKRRNELLVMEDRATDHRPILDEYTVPLLDQMTAVVTASTVVAYSLYTVTAENLPENHAMIATVPFVVYGIFRYLYLVHRKNLGGSPEDILLSDAPLIVDIVLWLATAVGIFLVFRA